MTDKTTDWIDGWLPDWQFEERHHLHSRATPARLMDAAAAYRPDDDRLIGAALALRESPEAFATRVRDELQRWGPIVKATGFTPED